MVQTFFQTPFTLGALLRGCLLEVRVKYMHSSLDCFTGDLGLSKIVKSFESNLIKIRVLSIPNNKLTHAGVQVLAQWIEVNNTLTELYIQSKRLFSHSNLKITQKLEKKERVF